MDDCMLPNEKSLLDIRRSPLALLRGLFDLTVALLLLWGMLKAMAEVPFWDSWWLVEQYRELATRFLWEGAGIPAGWIAAVFGLLAFLVGLGALRQLIREASRRYSVTSLRILSRRGFIGRATDELYLLSVDGVSLHQSPLGRLLGHADLIIAGRGNNQLKFTFVRSPDEVREKVDRIVLARRTKQPQD